MGLDSGRIHGKLIGFELPGKTFGHLAATGIAGAEKK
jgi:hypothetical protein